MAEETNEAAKKAAKFKKIAANAQELADLAALPIVKEYFAKAEQRYTMEMVNAAAGDDDTRRGAACMLKAVRELQAMMTTGTSVAKAAQGEYVRLSNETEEG